MTEQGAVTCVICARPRGAGEVDTGIEARLDGQLTGWLCPDCEKTPEQYARFSSQFVGANPQTVFVERRLNDAGRLVEHELVGPREVATDPERIIHPGALPSSA